MRKNNTMKSTRRKNLMRKKNKGMGKSFKFLVLLFLVLGIFLFVYLRTVYWNGRDKLAFAFRMNSGDVGVTVADPKLIEITTLVIPGDTQVDVAENYGTFRIKNVWQLSQNEKLKGRLLPETITQNFLFPTFLWADISGINIGNSSLSGIVKFIFASNATNIPFGDRLNLALFALKVKGPGRTEINLGQSQFLRKLKLNDGQTGYVLNGQPSSRLTVYFTDNTPSVSGTKVNIVDATGTSDVANKVGQIIEVMGAKVVSVEKKEPVGFGCEIAGADSEIVKKVLTLFSCTDGSRTSDFDLEIRLGQDFAKRF